MFSLKPPRHIPTLPEVAVLTTPPFGGNQRGERPRSRIVALSARRSPPEVSRTGEVSTLASDGITPVEHHDNSEHRPGIDDLRCVIQNNSDALSAGFPKFFMTVARQYRHQARD